MWELVVEGGPKAIGGAAGGLAGYVIARPGDKLAGVLIGALIGAVLSGWAQGQGLIGPSAGGTDADGQDTPQPWSPEDRTWDLDDVPEGGGLPGDGPPGDLELELGYQVGDPLDENGFPL